MKRLLTSLLLGVCIASSLTSCASIMHGSRQNIGISSNPTNAAIFVDGMYMGATPLIVNLTRRENHIVRIELEGFQAYEATFTPHCSYWVFGNIVFGGPIGLLAGTAIDAITGGLYELTPDQVQAELRSQNIACSGCKDHAILVVLEPKPEWKKIGNLVAKN